jgi:hypothetical protein
MLNPSNLTPLTPRRASRIGRHVEWFTRENELRPDAWRRFAEDLESTIATHPHASRGTLLRGYYGEGAPIFTAEQVTFNGNCDQRKWRYRQMKGNPRFSCNPGEDDDAHDPFDLRRHRVPHLPDRYQMHEELDTAGKPYGSIVLGALILMRYHFPEQTRIIATGSTTGEWQAASNHLRLNLGIQTMPPELATICRPMARRCTG